MKKIRVRASVEYEIMIDKGIIDRAGEYCLAAMGRPSRALILTDDNVAPLYLDRVRSSLEGSGFEVCEFIIPHGEESKSTESLVELLELMAQSRLTRSDILVALGGGVVGDLGGFAAAVYLRGIDFVQIPTTLLAAVDSSVGGKTAVDLKAGKNLMGAFHQPSLVLCDPTTLGTLKREVFADGCAEVIKYGVINDREFFDSLKKGIDCQVEEVIAACVANKARIVEGDEFDKGQRQLLNLGHTVGHAIELCSGLQISHGSAVAMGMVIAMRGATALGLCPEEDLSELVALLRSAGLPTECDFSAQELFTVATSDKKRAGDSIKLVLPYGIGDSRLYEIKVSELRTFIEKGLGV